MADKTGLRPMAGGAALSVIFSLIMYYLLQIIVVDLTEEIVQSTLTSPSIGTALSINYITWLYIMMIMFAALTGFVLAYDFKQSVLFEMLLASVATIVLLYFISYIAFTLSYPDIELNALGLFSLPTLFLSYVIRDINNFVVIVLAMEVTLFIVFSQMIT